MVQSRSWEANRFSASQKIPHIFWNPKVHTAYTSARHVSRSSARTIQSLTHDPTSWRCIVILSFHLRPDIPSCLLPSGLPHVNPVSTFTVSHTCHMTRPSNSWLYHPRNIWWGVQTINLRVMLSSPLPFDLVPLRPSFLPRHPILEHLQPVFLCQRRSVSSNINYLSCK